MCALIYLRLRLRLRWRSNNLRLSFGEEVRKDSSCGYITNKTSSPIHKFTNDETLIATAGYANHDYCDACKEGGDLLCCDRCPAAFHLLCHDPPLEDADIPPGEWICRRWAGKMSKRGLWVGSLSLGRGWGIGIMAVTTISREFWWRHQSEQQRLHLQPWKESRQKLQKLTKNKQTINKQLK